MSQQNPRSRKNEVKFTLPATPIYQFLNDLALKKSSQIRIGNSAIHVPLNAIPAAKVAASFVRRGILSKEVIAEIALKGVNVDDEADTLGISNLQLAAIYHEAMNSLTPEMLDEIKVHLAAPKGRGEIELDDPDYERFVDELRLKEIREISRKEIGGWLRIPDISFLLPKGPIQAVDHRPFLGDARNQAGRGTCTSFGSTVVAEALEFLRDSRSGPRDFSEELIFWYSKWGQLYTAGGYSCAAALRHYTEYGGCEEYLFPYDGKQISSNHAHVPSPDAAMDRSQFYRSDEVVSLPARDVGALKDLIRSGRCAGVISDTNGWNTGTGVISMPDPLDSIGIGGGHCTAIIGFIDRDDLPENHEGGYFIVRNSWGGAGSNTNQLGPEYGGHLLMPYGWYRRYTHSAYSLADRPDTSRPERKWLVEYFTNRSLSGKPLDKTVTVRVGVLNFFEVDVEVAVPQTVSDVDFNWGSGSPLTVDLPFPLDDVDVIPKDNFSIRFTQIRRMREGWYRFKLKGDDGIRLWVDDRLVINAWKDQPATEYVQEHYLTGGDHVLRVEYYERTGQARVSLDIEPINFEYKLYSNVTLAGSPAATFNDTLTDLEWRHAPPVSSVAHGQFSLRGTARLFFRNGCYRFHAIHTGGCKIWVEDQLVLDDWSGTNPSGAPVNINAGDHKVKVEFKHTSNVVPPGVKGYYKAALKFGWSQEAWQVSLYDDQKRKDIHDAGYPNIDSHYEAFRTQGLTGTPIFEYDYPANNNAVDQYYAVDGIPLILKFSKLDRFKNSIPGAGAVVDNFLGAFIRRKIFIPESGTYNFNLKCDDGFRLIVDGKQVLEDHHIIGADQFNDDLYLTAGVHDIAIEYSNTKWGGKVEFEMNKARWNVKYYNGTNFDTFVQSKYLDKIDKIIAERPTAVGSSYYSVSAKRTIWLPLGRYRLQIRTDDGARLKVNGVTQIDAWTTQAPRSYHTYLEHKGGNLSMEVQYFQQGGGAVLEFVLLPEGYFGEYYRGLTLQKTEAGAALDRNVPIAYRFEPTLDFDWGAGNRLDRIGADNFSARWYGKVYLPVGRWQIELKADDGVRLFMDGRCLINEWQPQSVTHHTKTVDLAGRWYSFRLEYFEKTGKAVCQLKFVRLF